MKKILTSAAIASVVLLGCNQVPTETATPEATPAAEVTQETPAPEVATPEVASLAVAVTSVADKAVVTTAPVVISGTVSKEATEVTVNGWKLTSYKPGSGVWNYIAKPEFKNLKDGENTYAITAKDAAGAEATTQLTFTYQSGS